MKKIVILLVGLFALNLSYGQTESMDFDMDMRYLELLMQSEKRALINESMNLSTEEGKSKAYFFMKAYFNIS